MFKTIVGLCCAIIGFNKLFRERMKNQASERQVPMINFAPKLTIITELSVPIKSNNHRAPETQSNEDPVHYKKLDEGTQTSVDHTPGSIKAHRSMRNYISIHRTELRADRTK
jgi:hypothetical protein